LSTRLDEEFTVPLPPGQAWRVLLDGERVAACLPGATLDSRDADICTGRLKVRAGPVTVTYRGQAELARRDDAAHTAVIEARASEARGGGTADATVTASLHEHNGGTRVHLTGEFTVTGRLADHDRDLAEVGSRLVARFAENLAQTIEVHQEPEADRPVETSVPEPTESPEGTGAPGDEAEEHRRNGWEEPGPQDEALDLLVESGRPFIVRAALAGGALLVALIILRRLLRRR
jgi:uncharacterized protein